MCCPLPPGMIQSPSMRIIKFKDFGNQVNSSNHPAVLFLNGFGAEQSGKRDDANDKKSTVMRYNGSSWEHVGDKGFSDDAWYLSLAINENGGPYVAYKVSCMGSKITVMRHR